MKHILAIGGEPATGKTSIVRGIISRLGGKEAFEAFQFGLVRGMYQRSENLMILGLYDETVFAGTDRLSMAVIGDALLLIENMKIRSDFKDTTLLFEGDRLFNKKFLDACILNCDTSIVFLNADEDIKIQRHKQRGDTQKEKWLLGRKTKVKNLILAFPQAVIYDNENEVQKLRIIHRLLGLIARKEFQS